MKTVKKILTHPLLIILVFCGIIISGEQMGGFYLLYILLGAGCMIASLVYFFLQPNGRYNYNTFYEALPLITLVIFSVLIIVFILSNSTRLFHKTGKTNEHYIV
jgi:hypothetical protein